MAIKEKLQFLGIMVLTLIVNTCILYGMCSPVVAAAAVSESESTHLVSNRTSSGNLVIGGTTVFQLQEAQKTKKASVIAVKGGSYTGQPGAINSDKGQSIIMKFIKQSLKKKGYCNITIFSTDNTLESADNMIDFAESLNKNDNINITIVSESNRASKTYNSYLHEKLLDSQGIKHLEMKTCSEEATSFKKSEAKKIWSKIL